jgi:hypothetical protein
MPVGYGAVKIGFTGAACLSAVLLLGTSAARAQTPLPSAPAVTGTSDWDQWKRNCSFSEESLQKFIECMTSTFRSRPFHFVAQSIVPGSGVGGGGRYEYDPDAKNGTQNQLVATSLITIRQFWFAELAFNSQIPVVADWNPSEQALAFDLYARNRSLPTLPFYGIGPNTNVNDSVRFSERDTRAGVAMSAPVWRVPWLSAGAAFEGLWPSIGGVTGKDIVSIAQNYTEQTAPGLASQPPFVHSQFFLNPHQRFRERFEINYRVAYDFFHDTGTGHYSFGRFEAHLDHRFYPQTKKHGGAIEQNYFSFMWRYSVSQASSGNAVPFYLEQTLGGSDIDNEPSLRAFRDYRFRGPDLMTVEAEYDRKLCQECKPCKEGVIRTLCDHLGLLVDYDAGKVALRKSDLDFSDMHQSFGGGLAIYLGKDVVFRMAVALGGGEGTHPYFGIANFLP